MERRDPGRADGGTALLIANSNVVLWGSLVVGPVLLASDVLGCGVALLGDGVWCCCSSRTCWICSVVLLVQLC